MTTKNLTSNSVSSFENMSKGLPNVDRASKLKRAIGFVIDKITGLEVQSETVSIFTKCNKEVYFYHQGECCEEVYLADFDCDITDFNGAIILDIEGVQNEDNPSNIDASTTWTFYKIKTDKGDIWMRWVGESNGYYSELMSFSIGEKQEDIKLVSRYPKIVWDESCFLNCENCKNCKDCEDCKDCKGCYDCTDCKDCEGCKDCKGCHNCKLCFDCKDCHNCKLCYDCTDCKDCFNCKDCQDLTDKIGWINNEAPKK